MDTRSTQELLNDLEILSGIKIRCIEGDIERHYNIWSREFPTVLTSYMYNRFNQLSVLDHLNVGLICHVSYHLGIENLYIPVEKGRFIIIGPYSSAYLPITEINNRLAEYRIPPTQAVYNFFSNQLPLISVHKIQAIQNLVCTSLSLSADRENVMHLHEPENQLYHSNFIKNSEISDQKKFMQRHEEHVAFIKAVSEGDYEKCLQISANSFRYKIDKHYSPEAFTNEVVSTIYNGAIFYFAAVKGGVSPGDADKMYTFYIQKLLNETTIDSIYKISADMLQAFCSLVLEQRSPVHSQLIQQVINYLSLHLDTELDKKDLCLSFKISQGKLEKLFKDECSTTITKFHRSLRLKKAAVLLENQFLSINEIAAQTGFLDQNYFSRVFKSVYGCTPNEYRTNKLNDHWNTDIFTV